MPRPAWIISTIFAIAIGTAMIYAQFTAIAEPVAFAYTAEGMPDCGAWQSRTGWPLVFYRSPVADRQSRLSWSALALDIFCVVAAMIVVARIPLRLDGFYSLRTLFTIMAAFAVFFVVRNVDENTNVFRWPSRGPLRLVSQIGLFAACVASVHWSMRLATGILKRLFFRRRSSHE